MSVSIPRTDPITPAEPLDGTPLIPPLEEGDHLTRDEFERRYDAMPHLKKAELIEGVVHVPSPVRQRHHSAPHTSLVGWLFLYRARTPGVESGDNPSVRLDSGNMPQPDAVLFVQPEYRDQVIIDADDYISGAPDLVAEVAATPRVTTCTTSSRLTSAIESSNTSCGASSSTRSTGSSCVRADTSGSLRRRTGSCAARFFPVCGWIRPRRCATISTRCWPSTSAASTPRSTRTSSSA